MESDRKVRDPILIVWAKARREIGLAFVDLGKLVSEWGEKKTGEAEETIREWNEGLPN